MQVSELLNAIR